MRVATGGGAADVAKVYYSPFYSLYSLYPVLPCSTMDLVDDVAVVCALGARFGSHGWFGWGENKGGGENGGLPCLAWSVWVW